MQPPPRTAGPHYEEKLAAEQDQSQYPESSWLARKLGDYAQVEDGTVDRCERRVAAVTHSWWTFLFRHLTNTSGQGLWAGGLGLSICLRDSVAVDAGSVQSLPYLRVLHLVGTHLFK